MDLLIYIVLCAELTAAICATVYFNKYQYSKLKWVLPLMWYIPINEIFCQFIVQNGDHHIFYNIYYVVTSIAILWLVKNQIKKTKGVKIINIFIALTVISFIVNLISINPFQERLILGFTIAALLIVIALLYYLVELLQSNIIINPSRDIFLWFCSGFLIFHISNPVIRFARDMSNDMSPTLWDSIYIIQAVIVVISYLTIAFGFYWGEKRVTQ